ncbi:MAG: hypothetical protein FWH21_00165 [Kiritimatiellaeota bacterium]|nr:hypothetical protein [Kiritimatiellota bacterium]
MRGSGLGVKGFRGSGSTALDGNRQPSTAIESLTPNPLNPLTPEPLNPLTPNPSNPPPPSRAKARCDAWDARLTDAQRWQVYDLFRRSPWYSVAKFVEEEHKVPQPSRTSLYNWAGRMRGMESAHKVEQAIIAKEEIGTLAATVSTDRLLIDAYKSLAADLALQGDARTAVRYTQMAMDIAAGQSKAKELELKARAQETKDEQLKLAREKFEAAERRLAEAKQIVANETLTDEERTAKMKEIFGL